MRILIHAGFHKTGTTSVQAALRRNREALAPWLRLRLPGQTRTLRQAARAALRRGGQCIDEEVALATGTSQHC